MTWEVREGDCVELMAAMEADSVDAIVTDPPYGLEFMGKEWDRLIDKRDSRETKLQVDRRYCRPRGTDPYVAARVNYVAGPSAQAWHGRWAAEALRVLKPGGHLLAFGGTRTSHRLVCALEDAGFEIRDTICWLHGQVAGESGNHPVSQHRAIKPEL